MWWNKWTQSNQVKVKVLWLKKEDTELFFEISKYENWKSIVLEDKAKWIDWKLVKVEVWGYKWEENGKEKFTKTLSFLLNDWENDMLLSIWFNILSRNIIYNLASQDKIDGKVEFSLYISKSGNKYCWVKVWWVDCKNGFDFEKDIKWRTKPLLDEDWEFIKYSYKELDGWIENTLVPKINSSIVNGFESIESDEDFIGSIEREAESKTAKAQEDKMEAMKDKIVEERDWPF